MIPRVIRGDGKTLAGAERQRDLRGAEQDTERDFATLQDDINRSKSAKPLVADRTLCAMQFSPEWLEWQREVKSWKEIASMINEAGVKFIEQYEEDWRFLAGTEWDYSKAKVKVFIK